MKNPKLNFPLTCFWAVRLFIFAKRESFALYSFMAVQDDRKKTLIFKVMFGERRRHFSHSWIN